MLEGMLKPEEISDCKHVQDQHIPRVMQKYAPPFSLEADGYQPDGRKEAVVESRVQRSRNINGMTSGDHRSKMSLLYCFRVRVCKGFF